MAKYWTNNLAIWSHWFQPLQLLPTTDCFYLPNILAALSFTHILYIFLFNFHIIKREFVLAREQCDQMTKKLYAAIYNNKISTCSIKIVKLGSRFCQILRQPSKNCQRLLTFCKSGKISPNPVTLSVSHRLVLRRGSIWRNFTLMDNGLKIQSEITTIIFPVFRHSWHRTVASDTRDPRFDSCHWQFYLLSAVLNRQK